MRPRGDDSARLLIRWRSYNRHVYFSSLQIHDGRMPFPPPLAPDGMERSVKISQSRRNKFWFNRVFVADSETLIGSDNASRGQDCAKRGAS